MNKHLNNIAIRSVRNGVDICGRVFRLLGGKLTVLN